MQLQSGFWKLRHLRWLSKTQISTDPSSKVFHFRWTLSKRTFSKWITWKLHDLVLSAFRSFHCCLFVRCCFWHSSLCKGARASIVPIPSHGFWLPLRAFPLAEDGGSEAPWRPRTLQGQAVTRQYVCDVLSRNSHQPCKSEDHHEITGWRGLAWRIC